MPGTLAASSLQELCLRRFCLHLSEVAISGLSAERARQGAAEARSHLVQNAPPCFFEEMAHATLALVNKHFYNPKHKPHRPAMAEVAGWLLGEHIRHLSLDQCRMLCDRLAVPLVFESLARMPRLEALAIGRLNFWKIPELSTLADRLTGLPNLTTLRLEYICLPAMLQGLAEKCPRLLELSLKDSEKISNAEVPEIVRCLQLHVLNISGTSITGSGSWDILNALPLLTSFEHCPFNCNSGPFLFDSREAMLSYIWDVLSPEGRALSAGLPSVTGQMALPARRARQPPGAGPAAEAATGRSEEAALVEAAEVPAGAGAAAAESAEGPAEAGAGHPAETVPAEAADGALGEASVGVTAREDTSADGRAAGAVGRSAPGPGGSDPSSDTQTPRVLGIENFWLFNPKTEEVALARLCPAVRRLRLDFVFQDIGQTPDLGGLSQFQHVTHLEINSFDAPRFSVVSEVLRHLGGRLTELALHVCDDYTATAALENAVARWCPGLERYAFTGDYSAAELRVLRLDGELRHLDDAGFRELLAVNALPRLEEFWVNVSSGLTLEAVLPLLFDPTCCLRRLGRLSSLQGLDRQRFLELRSQARALNLDVDLVWVTPGV
ncbi:uncharacterized protein LOC119095690 [Pollicipes pollicipes]|uniref:uncharacterized protein LOC119095690 n=1 Tax=Pollicipes pollicipes TaxID=41117 RepID=UPI0018849328|nr:uncharacterized protein LOC119095690 [Pollicipes pollicipes]